MSEMVERVGRALYEDKLTQSGPPWDAVAEGYKIKYRARARVAIAAMREPTDQMVSAAILEDPSYIEIDVQRMWQAMIDAAQVPDELLGPTKMPIRHRADCDSSICTGCA
jgi:hypothetical protein